jgi:hypothetical protein
MRAFTIAEQDVQREIQEATDQIAKLMERQKSLPVRIPLAESHVAEKAMRLSIKRKHLTNVLKMVAYQIEGSLVELLRPYYPRAEDEGRTLIQIALQSDATIEPSEDELRLTLAPLSSAYRSQAIAALYEHLDNKTVTCFPGTKLRLHFAVADSLI